MSFWKTREKPPFNKLLGITVEDSGPGHVTLSVKVKPEHYNHLGIPHGGFIATLMDVACGMAGIVTDTPGNICPALTLTLTINYLAQARSTNLKVCGRVTRSGRKIYFSQAELFDSEDTLLATATGAFKYLGNRDGNS